MHFRHIINSQFCFVFLLWCILHNFYCIYMKISLHIKWMVLISNIMTVLHHELFILSVNRHHKWKVHHYLNLAANFHSFKFIFVLDIRIWNWNFLCYKCTNNNGVVVTETFLTLPTIGILKLAAYSRHPSSEPLPSWSRVPLKLCLTVSWMSEV